MGSIYSNRVFCKRAFDNCNLYLGYFYVHISTKIENEVYVLIEFDLYDNLTASLF